MNKCNRSSGKGDADRSQRPEAVALRNRVRAVGPEKFGLIVVDPHKNNSAVKVANFYGDTLLAVQSFPNTEPGLAEMVRTAKECLERNGIVDAVAGIERTGQYHGPAKRALRRWWEVKMIHPYVTKRLRQPASPGVKTDGADLDAMVRAMITGYGTDEPELPQSCQEWRLVNRMREDLVGKRACVKVQCRVTIEASMPGYDAIFEDVWKSRGALALAELYGSAASLRTCTPEQIRDRLRRQGVQVMRPTIDRVLAWAAEAAEPDPAGRLQNRILHDHLRHYRWLTREICAYDIDLLRYLAKTPAVVLLSIPGINVASAAGYVGELGPASDYVNAKRITGRAGMFPSRYQSDGTDRADGPIVGGHNARLRDAILEVARNLIQHNPHFRGWAAVREQRGWPRKKIRMAVGNRFTRISHAMLTGGMVFAHPSQCERDSVLAKILCFARDHGIRPREIERVLKQVAGQLPADALQFEVKALESGAWRAYKCHRMPGQPEASACPDLGRILKYLWRMVENNQERAIHGQII